MQDLGYDGNANDSWDNFDYQEQRRKNMEEIRLAKCDVFIVPAALFFHWSSPEGTSLIGEARLMGIIL